MFYECIIIGSGPAGISAALYTIRANVSTLIIGTDESELKKAEKIENYYGFAEPVSGEYLLEQGKSQVKRLGGSIIDDEVIGIEKTDKFIIKTQSGEYTSNTVLIATGQPAVKVKIKNIKKYEGRGISYCTTCDGFFFRDKKVGILGYNDFAISEAMELKPFTKDITIFTNGNELQNNADQDLSAFKIDTNKIVEIEGQDFLKNVVFESGNKQELDGLFIAYGSASSTTFALKLGIIINNNAIEVNEKQETNIEGLYAAGDCTGGFKQVSTAVGHGAIAGRQIIEYCREIKNKAK